MPPTNCQKQLWTPFESVPASLLGRFFTENCDLRWNYSSPRVREAQSVQLMERRPYRRFLWFLGVVFFSLGSSENLSGFILFHWDSFCFWCFFYVYVTMKQIGKRFELTEADLRCMCFSEVTSLKTNIISFSKWSPFWEHLHFPRCETGVVSKKNWNPTKQTKSIPFESVIQFCNRSSADVKP